MMRRGARWTKAGAAAGVLLFTSGVAESCAGAPAARRSGGWGVPSRVTRAGRGARGAMIGGMRRRDQVRQQEVQQAQTQQMQASQMDAFNRAQATCLQTRGYSVN